MVKNECLAVEGAADVGNCGKGETERGLSLLPVQGLWASFYSQLNAFASGICSTTSPSVAVLTWIWAPVKVLGLPGAAVMLAVPVGPSTPMPLMTAAKPISEASCAALMEDALFAYMLARTGTAPSSFQSSVIICAYDASNSPSANNRNPIAGLWMLQSAGKSASWTALSHFVLSKFEELRVIVEPRLLMTSET